MEGKNVSIQCFVEPTPVLHFIWMDQLKEDFYRRILCLLLLFCFVLRLSKWRKSECWPGQTLNSVNFDTEIVTMCYYSSLQPRGLSLRRRMFFTKNPPGEKIILTVHHQSSHWYFTKLDSETTEIVSTLSLWKIYFFSFVKMHKRSNIWSVHSKGQMKLTFSDVI